MEGGVGERKAESGRERPRVAVIHGCVKRLTFEIEAASYVGGFTEHRFASGLRSNVAP